MCEKRLASNSALTQKMHVLSKGGRRVRQGQHAIPYLSNKITYSLRTAKMQDYLSVSFCTLPNKNHILAESGERVRRGQRAILQLSN